MRRMSIVHKLLCIFALSYIPGYEVGQFYPFVFRIEFSVWKYEILKLELSDFPVHPTHSCAKFFTEFQGLAAFNPCTYYTINQALPVVFVMLLVC